MRRILGGKTAIAHSLRLTGHAVRLRGDLERAATLYKESLALFGETKDKWAATECLDGLALIASVQGNSEQAGRILGAVEAARERFGITMARLERGRNEQPQVARVEDQKNATLSADWAEGRSMTLEQAIGYALQSEG